MRLIYILLYLSALIGCGVNLQRRDAVLEVVFLNSLEEIRGVELGQEIKAILSNEKLLTVVYQDSMGLVYEWFNKKSKVRIEYYVDSSKKGVGSIVVNVFTKDEKVAPKIYDAFVEYINVRFKELPNGNYGQYKWELVNSNRYLELKLHNFKKDITLNYRYL